MIVEYVKLPWHSRVWVYQSSNALTLSQQDSIAQKTTFFLSNWIRHGAPIQAGFTLLYRHFLILAVDERITPVSGCSIDASVHYIQDLEQLLGVCFLDKMQVAFRDSGNIKIIDLHKFKKYIERGIITEKTIVFNNMVATKADVKNFWEVPAGQSWHQRFFK